GVPCVLRWASSVVVCEWHTASTRSATVASLDNRELSSGRVHDMTRFVGIAPADVTWALGGMKGLEFETIIARHLQALYAYNRDAIHVEQTRESHDRGRDIIITTRLGISLFGIETPPRVRRPTKIYIECKLRTGDRLEPEFFFDFAQFPDEGVPDH